MDGEQDMVDGGDDWLIGRVGPVVVLYAARKLDDPNFARYLELLARTIDSVSPQQRVGSLYEVHEPSSVDAHRRRQL